MLSIQIIALAIADLYRTQLHVDVDDQDMFHRQSERKPNSCDALGTIGDRCRLCFSMSESTTTNTGASLVSLDSDGEL